MPRHHHGCQQSTRIPAAHRAARTGRRRPSNGHGRPRAPTRRCSTSRCRTASRGGPAPTRRASTARTGDGEEHRDHEGDRPRVDPRRQPAHAPCLPAPARRCAPAPLLLHEVCAPREGLLPWLHCDIGGRTQASVRGRRGANRNATATNRSRAGAVPFGQRRAVPAPDALTETAGELDPAARPQQQPPGVVVAAHGVPGEQPGQDGAGEPRHRA